MNIRNISIDLLKTTLDTIIHFQRYGRACSKTDVIDITKKSVRSVENALFMLDQLKCLEIKNGSLELTPDCFAKLSSGVILDKVITDYALLFPPFNEYLYLKSLSKPDEETGNLVKHIFDLDSNVQTITSVMNSWIRTLNIEIKMITENKASEDLMKEIESENDALLLIRHMISHDISVFPPVVLADIKEGLLISKNKPADALTDIGRALEIFLRIRFQEVDLTKKNGIGEIALELRNKNKISSKLVNILLALASIRTMGDAHGLDKDEGKTWQINPITPVLFGSLTLKVIDSIVSHKEGKLIF